jgi:hypothetical protein
MVETVVQLVLGGVLLFAAGWVWKDANRLKKMGLDIRPSFWAVAVLILGLIFLPLYFATRSRLTESDGALKRTGPSDLLVWGICAVFAAFASAVTVTWQLVTRNPALDEESYALGLLVFFFIVLFDLFLLPPLALTKAREANAWTAVLWSLKFFLGGLLAATGFVVSGALFFRLLSKYPQIGTFLDSEVVLFLLLITHGILFLRRWQAGKTLREKQASAGDG